MSKRRRILLAVLVLTALTIVAGVWFLRPEPEPVYQGKRLSQWLTDITADGDHFSLVDREPAEDAVRHMGTNAIPTALRLLRVKDSALKLKLISLAQERHLLKAYYVTASARNCQAAIAFHVLGAQAKGAVPSLLRIAEENISPESRSFAISALGSVGPDAAAAVPLLVRVAAAGDDPSQDTLSRCSATSALGDIHAQPQLVIPVMRQLLDDPNFAIRQRAAEVLASFDTSLTKPAVPQLVELLKNANPYVRAAAARLIVQIDPESAELRKAELDAALAPEKQ